MLVLGASGTPAQSILTADGVTPAYTRIKSVLAASPETPDCSHPSFGPHITQAVDDELAKYVFVFNIHVTPDNDRCKNFDRQRLEIKTEGNSSTPDYLKGFLGDTVTFRWLFRLPEGFQPSYSFTHIHQIKAYDGDAGAPLITLTPRFASPNQLELIHINSSGVTTKLATTDLAPFLGKWVDAYEKITYGHDGQYLIILRSRDDGQVLFTYSNSDLDLWRTDTTVVRPKWGIYRSLNHPEQLRDEQVKFDRFCLAKGTDDCLSDKESPDFTLAAKCDHGATPAGSTARVRLEANTLRGFGGDIGFSVTGLPPGASAQFSPATISGGAGSSEVSVAVAADTDAGEYPLIVSGISGILSHAARVSLVVSNFSLAVLQEAVTAGAGSNVKTNVAVTPLEGFDRAVYLSLGAMPSGISGHFSPPKLNKGAGSSILHLSVDSTTPAGTYQIPVTATSGPIAHSESFTLNVTN